MAETLRELVVALSLDSSNFSRNITDYRHWFPRMCDYGFVEGQDLVSFRGLGPVFRFWSLENGILKPRWIPDIMNSEGTVTGYNGSIWLVRR